jgi:DNA modification methylase
MKLGRRFIGMELEQKYVDLANRNIEKTKQALKQMVISGIEN